MRKTSSQNSKKNCKNLTKHFSKKIKNFSKTKNRLYKSSKRNKRKGIKRLMQTRRLINNVCKNKKSDPNCIELQSIYDNKSDIYNSIVNMLPKVRRGFKKGKSRLLTANRLSKKICRKH